MGTTQPCVLLLAEDPGAPQHPGKVSALREFLWPGGDILAVRVMQAKIRRCSLCTFQFYPALLEPYNLGTTKLFSTILALNFFVCVQEM